MKKNYEVWPGTNRFLCWGRCVTGPDRRYFYFALAFITVPAIFFCAFMYVYLLFRKISSARASLLISRAQENLNALTFNKINNKMAGNVLEIRTVYFDTVVPVVPIYDVLHVHIYVSHAISRSRYRTSRFSYRIRSR